MDVHYQPIHDNADDVDGHDSLWDELNDQQSREVQQHQSRFHAPSIGSRTHPTNIMVSMVTSTAERVGASAQSAWSAAQQAWMQHPTAQLQQQRQGSRRQGNHRDRYIPAWYQYPRAARRDNAIHDLDQEFGLNDLRPNTIHEEDVTSSPQRQNHNNNPTTNPFVLLTNLPSRQAISNEEDHWGMVANMDVFLTHLYQYYYHRGLTPIVCKFLVECTSLFFTLWLSRILMSKVNWHLLATTCKDETTCMANWSDYYYENTDTKIGWIHWGLEQGYTLLFLGYGVFFVWRFWQSLHHVLSCQYIVHEKLGISKRKLQGGAVAWDTVVTQLIQAQDSGEYRLALQQLDPLNIAQRIMRKENFLIAFWNQGLLDCTLIRGRHYWCPSLEWCIHTCVLNFMFNHKYEIRPAFYLDAASLERRLQVCGIVHFVLLPFLILFVFLHFLLRNIYDFKTTRQYMGDKQWSAAAQWTFREFNELPHVLEQRLEPSYEAAESYLKLFGTSEWMAALGKLFVFCGGAVGGIIFVLGVLNDAILLHVQLWGRNLLWYGGIAGIVYGIGKALLPTKESQPSAIRNLFADMDAALKNVSTHTHYYPENWKGRGWDSTVHSSFGKLFDSKVKLFVWEMASLILAPYILFARLSKCAPAICEFCLAIETRIPGSGDVCGYSSFDFDIFKDEAWEGRTLGKSVMLQRRGTNGANGDDDDDEPPHPMESLSESILRTGNVEEATRQHPKPKAREGKMEKSFFSFQAAHPDWKCSPSGQSLVDRVEEYRKAELAAISRERGLYIEAAARQLETLARLEQQQQQLYPNGSIMLTPRSRFQQERLHESHIPRVAVPPADAGAGSHNIATLQQQQGQQQGAYHHQEQQQQQKPAEEDHMRSMEYRADPPPSLPSLLHLGHPYEHAPPSTVNPATTLPFSHHENEIPNQRPDPPRQQQQHQPVHAPPPPPPTQPLRVASIETTASSDMALANSNALLQMTESSARMMGHPHHGGLGLSTELRRILDMSSLHASESVLQESSSAPAHHSVATSTNLPEPMTTPTERQYFWLERFHEHLERQRQHEEMTGGASSLGGSTPHHLQDVANSEPLISRSLPTHYETETATTATTRGIDASKQDHHSASSMV